MPPFNSLVQQYSMRHLHISFLYDIKTLQYVVTRGETWNQREVNKKNIYRRIRFCIFITKIKGDL